MVAAAAAAPAASSISAWAPTALTVAGNLAGGLISSGADKDAAREAGKNARKVMKKQLQWRVRDAKEAGLHPLFALGGGGVSAGGFMPGSGQSAMGTAVADSAAAIGRAIGKKNDPLVQANLRAVNASANRDEAAAAHYNALAAKELQQVNSSQDGTAMSGAGLAAALAKPSVGAKVPAGVVQPKAVDQYSAHRKKTGLVAGLHQSMGEIKLPNGRTMLVPLEDGQPSLQAAEGFLPALVTIMANFGLLPKMKPAFSRKRQQPYSSQSFRKRRRTRRYAGRTGRQGRKPLTIKIP